MKPFLVAAVAVAGAAAAYLAARAALAPLTYDEASSYYRYVDADLAALFDFATATNHFLNSLLSRVSSAVFGGSPLALRLPNLLAGVAFLACAIAFARRARVPAIGLAGAVLLSTNPYLLDYLALSRGYGLGLALLMAALYYFLRWCGRPSGQAGAGGLSTSLGLAAAAVAANFASLPAFLALVMVAVVRLLADTVRHPPAADPRPLWSWRTVAVWLLATATFTALVFSRERVLSSTEFVPIVVRVTGLFEEELAGIHVFRVDSTGRLRDLPRRPGGLWNSGPVQDDWALHIVMPAAADRNLARLDVIMGDEVFRRDRLNPGPWTVEDSDGDRVLISTGALSWQGNRAHQRLVLAHTAATLALLALAAVLLAALARTEVVVRRVGRWQVRAIASAIIGVGSLVAAPLYLLRRDGQLFFGGSDGLLLDTVGSLVTGTAYGSADPALAGTASIAVVLAMLLPLAFAAWPGARRRAFRPAWIVLAVIGVIALQALAQHALFAVPFPTGRTALFLLPLALLLFVLTADAIASFGRVARAAATAVALIAAAASAWNAIRVANVSHTLDWLHDASTPAMLARVAGDRRPAPAVVRIGVEWMFYPVARYYAGRLSDEKSRYDIIVLPGDGRMFDFIYAPTGTDVGNVEVVEDYPVSGATLSRVRR